MGVINALELADGIHDLTREDYDRVDRVNFSTLKAFEQSPAHYAFALEQAGRNALFSKWGELEDDDTDARQRGRVVSMAVFEPNVYERRVVEWTGGQRRGKSWERFVDQHPDCEHVTPATYRNANLIAAAVRNSSQAAPFLTGGRGEVTCCWTHRVEPIAAVPGYTIKMKGRLDYWIPGRAIVDLKNTRNGSPEGFKLECARYLAHAQAAIYTDGIAAIGGLAIGGPQTGELLPYALIAVEPVPPFVVQVYRMPPDVIDVGRETYCRWLDRLNACRIESRIEHRWPGYAEAPLDLELPRWLQPQEEF